jgi:hypothetical protein
MTSGIRLNVKHGIHTNIQEADSLDRSYTFSPSSLTITPFSVTIAVINDAGVTSNAAFHTPIPRAAVLTVRYSPRSISDDSYTTGPRIITSSWAGLSSMTIPSPEDVDKSIDVVGAATRKGIL